MELIFEILLEAYLGLAEIIVPDHKFKKWQEVLLKLSCILVSLAVIICLAVGIAMFVEGDKTVGIALTAVGGSLLAIQIVIVIFVLVHEHKKSKEQSKGQNELEIIVKRQANNLLFDDDNEQ
ncbi:MAG: hypothetical protein K2G31_05935 [Clostridia bacterium]|nr:hypothetical protein [Clostridia bacterium]